MAAMELEWIPETLYNTAISAVVDNYSRSRRDIRSLPENIQFDVYYKVRFGGLKRPGFTQEPRKGLWFLQRLKLLAVSWQTVGKQLVSCPDSCLLEEYLVKAEMEWQKPALCSSPQGPLGR